MKKWLASGRSALHNVPAQWLLAFAFAVPAAATIGQYWSTGFWTKSCGLAVLYWPGQDWRVVAQLPVLMTMGAMIASYGLGVAWLAKRRTFTTVALATIAAMIVANLAAAGVNALTGWKETGTIASMDLVGKVNRAVFALWHDPVWEEVVFRGIPLALLLAYRRRRPNLSKWALAVYYIVPSVAMAIYHVPGHGPSRLVDTFILSLAFAWMALRYSFFAPLVMHYVLDAMMVIHLDKVRGIPSNEVTWIASHSWLLNSAWSILLLLWLGSIAIATLIYRYLPARQPETPIHV